MNAYFFCFFSSLCLGLFTLFTMLLYFRWSSNLWCSPICDGTLLCDFFFSSISYGVLICDVDLLLKTLNFWNQRSDVCGFRKKRCFWIQKKKDVLTKCIRDVFGFGKKGCFWIESRLATWMRTRKLKLVVHSVITTFTGWRRTWRMDQGAHSVSTSFTEFQFLDRHRSWWKTPQLWHSIVIHPKNEYHPEFYGYHTNVFNRALLKEIGNSYFRLPMDSTSSIRAK